MNGSVRVAAGIVSLLALAQQPTPRSGRAPLEGVWRRLSVTYRGPDTSWTNPRPQPSVYIFTKGYYSMMFVPGTGPRTPFTSGRPSAAERVTAFDSFRASSGTYLVQDSSLTIRPHVARVPNLMAGESQNYTYQLRGDSLWLTLDYPWARDTTQTARVRVRLVRLE
jgi:hypothetical protein